VTLSAPQSTQILGRVDVHQFFCVRGDALNDKLIERLMQGETAIA
jgi:hypothetical protein